MVPGSARSEQKTGSPSIDLSYRAKFQSYKNPAVCCNHAAEAIGWDEQHLSKAKGSAAAIKVAKILSFRAIAIENSSREPQKNHLDISN